MPRYVPCSRRVGGVAALLAIVGGPGCDAPPAVESPHSSAACPAAFVAAPAAPPAARLLAQTTHAATTGWHAQPPVEAISTGPTGRVITLGAVAYGDASLRIWDPPTRSLLRSIPLPGLAFPASATFDAAGAITVVDATQIIRLTADGDRLESAAWKPSRPRELEEAAFEGARVVGLLATRYGAFVRWSARSGQGGLSFEPWGGEARWLPLSGQAAPLDFVADPSAPTFVVDEYASRTVGLLSVGASAARPIAMIEEGIRVLGLAEGGRYAAVRIESERDERTDARQTELGLIDTSTKKMLWKKDAAAIAGVGSFAAGVDPAASSFPATASFSADGASLTMATSDGRMLMFDTATGRFRGEMGTKGLAVSRVSFMDEDHIIAAGGAGQLGRSDVWSLVTGRVTESYDGATVTGTRASGLWKVSGRAPDDAGDDMCGGGPILTVEAIGDASVSPREACLPTDRSLRALDPNAPRLLFDGGFARELLDLRTGKAVDVRVPVALTFFGQITEEALGLANLLAWSEDGSTLASLEPMRRKEIRAAGIEREDRMTLVESPTRIDHFAISRDGTKLAAVSGTTVTLHAVGPTAPASSSFEVSSPPSWIAFGRDTDVVLGFEDGSLEIRRNGDAVLHGRPTGSAVRGIAVSPAQKRIVTTHADRSLRVWNAADGAHLVTLSAFENGEYLTATPAGAYVASREAARHVSFVFEQPLEAFSLEQLGPSFARPDLVRDRLGGLAVDLPRMPARPPRVGAAKAEPVSPDGRVKVSVGATSGRRVERVRAYVEGRAVEETLVCAPSGEAKFELPLLPGQNRVTLVAYDDMGVGSNASVLDVTSATVAGTRPDVWVVAIGVSRYPNLGAEMQLEYADDDARDLAAAFSAQAGPDGPYAAAHVTTLLDKDVTPRTVVAALSTLSASKPEDVVVVFFSGHGMKAAGADTSVYLTHDAILSKDGPTSGSVGWDEIGASLARVRGRVVVFMDACHSGAIQRDYILPNEALARLLASDGRNGSIVFAASKGRQQSFEPNHAKGTDRVKIARYVSGATDHGLFTAAILDALASPGADTNDDGALQLSELVEDVTARVNLASTGRQTPWLARREIIGDFRLATVRAPK